MTTAGPTLDAPPPPPTIGDGARRPREVTDEPTRADRVFGVVTTSAGATSWCSSAWSECSCVLRRRRFDIGGWSFFTTERVAHRRRPARDRRARPASRGTIIVGPDRGRHRHPARASAPPSSSRSTPAPAAHAAHARRRPAGRHPEPALRHLGLPATSGPDRPAVGLARPALRLDPDLRDRARTRIFAGSMFIAGIVVSLMVLPIVASVEPRGVLPDAAGEKEAALALGGPGGG